jgi:hypothetical protein
MESKKEIEMDNAFETTYQIVTGDMSIEMLVGREASINLLYDPFQLSKKGFVDVIEWLMEYYIEQEEYMRCAKLRDILADKKSHASIIDEIVLDELDD